MVLACSRSGPTGFGDAGGSARVGEVADAVGHAVAGTVGVKAEIVETHIAFVGPDSGDLGNFFLSYGSNSNGHIEACSATRRLITYTSKVIFRTKLIKDKSRYLFLVF